MERNSDWTLYNINSEGWFQCWSVIAGVIMVMLWFWIADQHYSIVSTGYDDEDLLRLKDCKATLIWERTFWSFIFYLHGQHMGAFRRELTFYTNDQDNPQLNVRATYNIRNKWATDRYYKGWGKMRDMRIM